MDTLTQERLKQVVDYDPCTGVFVWKLRPTSEWAAPEKAMTWNTRYAGRRAGCETHGYIKISVDDAKYYAHRLAWLYMTGSMPSNVIDHIDHNGKNNSWTNLRDVGKQQNAINLRKPRENKTGYTGVVRLPSGRFMAQKKRAGGRGNYLGSFDTAEDAHAAYLNA